MKAYDEAVRLLPMKTAAVIGREAENAEEFRLRTGFEATALIAGTEMPLGGGMISQSDISTVIEKATGASVHAFKEDIAKGFIGCRYGIRIGLCGTGVYGSGQIITLRDISSLCIRIPHEVHGCAEGAVSAVLDKGNTNILILSPPGCGKTTLVRDCVRLLSDSGVRVSVADERGEIAAVLEGKPQFEVGRSCDIMTDVPKSQAVMMMLRSMNPQVIVMDEISSPEDISAAQSAAGCGVRIIATAHAAEIRDLYLRPVYRELIKSGIFTDAVIINNKNGQRSYSCEVIA